MNAYRIKIIWLYFCISFIKLFFKAHHYRHHFCLINWRIPWRRLLQRFLIRFILNVWTQRSLPIDPRTDSSTSSCASTRSTSTSWSSSRCSHGSTRKCPPRKTAHLPSCLGRTKSSCHLLIKNISTLVSVASESINRHFLAVSNHGLVNFFRMQILLCQRMLQSDGVPAFQFMIW